MILKFTEEHLKAIFKKKGVPVPNQELIFFGIRGASPLSAIDTEYHQTQAIKEIKPNYEDMCCTIGIWNTVTKRTAIFLGSTVPHISSVAAAKAKGGKGANQMVPGYYPEHFKKGTHYPRPETAHLAFVQAKAAKIQRTSDDLDYDKLDPVTLELPYDNLHSAFSYGKDYFASAGCQVVAGFPKCQKISAESGPWKTFKEIAYKSKQDYFSYLLIEVKELVEIIKSLEEKE